MGSSKKISVIVPVYNVEKYLRECLDSIINQTFKDIEIICVNDGSTDGSLEILEEYASKDDRIIIINQENQGLGKTRNYALSIVQGEYIAFVDSDDFIRPDAYEIVYNKFKETDVDIVLFDFATCKENGRLSKKHSLCKSKEQKLSYKLKNNSVFKLSDFKRKTFTDLTLYCWDKVYKTKFIKDNNIYFSTARFCEDQIFSISSYLLAKKILYINEHLYVYRTRESSLIHEPSKDIVSAFYNIDILKNFLIKNNLLESYQNEFENYMRRALHSQYQKLAKEKNEEFLQKCKDLLKPEEYQKFLKEMEPKLSLGQRIFSITNQRINGKKHKLLCILGFKKTFNVQ